MKTKKNNKTLNEKKGLPKANKLMSSEYYNWKKDELNLKKD